MPTTQHTYQGAGSPVGVIFGAAAGSHYTDTDSGDTWTCADGGNWRQLAHADAPEVVSTGSAFVGVGYPFHFKRVFLVGTHLAIDSTIGDVYTNVPLTVDGVARRFTPSEPYYLDYSSSGDGVVFITGWPVTASAPPPV